MEQTRRVSHNGVALVFAVPNPLCDWRARTFATKEPETLEWIDGIPESAVLWDIGANVGLYTVYAARSRRCRVWAFEPSVFNLELLARNVYANDLTDRVCIVPLPLSDGVAASRLRLTTKEWGGAKSTFGRNLGWDGGAIHEVFEFQTLGLRMDDAVHMLGLPAPDYVKMDVDGLEHFILQGASDVLAGVRQVLIEVNDDFTEQATQCHALLTRSGLRLAAKRQSAILANSDGYQHSFNQIWVRD